MTKGHCVSAKLTVVILVLLDGLFHLLSSLQTFMDFAPDWIISSFFGNEGFGVLFHRLMGVILVASSLVALMFIKENSESSFDWIYYGLIAPITLGVIAIALLLKVGGLV